MQRLLSIGFKQTGYWALEDARLVFKIHGAIKSTNVLYSFISADRVLYVGKTTQTLSKRMRGYQNPGCSQYTNIRNNKNIKDLLFLKESVDIYALPDTGLLQFGQFKISLAAGLEDSLIKVLHPPWDNRQCLNGATCEDFIGHIT